MFISFICLTFFQPFAYYSITKMLNLCTYNMRGFNSTKNQFISELLQKYNIVTCQEHWRSNKQLESFSALFPGYYVHGISGLDSTQILRGSLKGGVLIIFPDSMSGKIEYLTTNSQRLCAIKIDVDGQWCSGGGATGAIAPVSISQGGAPLQFPIHVFLGKFAYILQKLAFDLNYYR